MADRACLRMDTVCRQPECFQLVNASISIGTLDPLTEVILLYPGKESLPGMAAAAMTSERSASLNSGLFDSKFIIAVAALFPLLEATVTRWLSVTGGAGVRGDTDTCRINGTVAVERSVFVRAMAVLTLDIGQLG